MPLEDWIHRYPKVQALLQGEEELLYNAEDIVEEPEAEDEAASTTGWTPGGESSREDLARLAAHLEHIRDRSMDETYRRELRELMADIVEELGNAGDVHTD